MSFLTESMEDYLEMFYRIIQEQGYIRPIDLSKAIQVKPSSVTRMIKKLDEAQFIVYEKYRNIALTAKGLRYGKFLVWRDETLKEFLRLLQTKVGVDEQVEGIEHYITPPTMNIIHNLILYFKTNPERLKELEELHQANPPHHDTDLKQLRAWLFRHNN
ncbi:MAG: transcriptional regulator MntR [Firmicutes bacterium]|nr:transcriptional regulator MntR [Bacillota bacterium]